MTLIIRRRTPAVVHRDVKPENAPRAVKSPAQLERERAIRIRNETVGEFRRWGALVP
jgi:hypothetical protein